MNDIKIRDMKALSKYVDELKTQPKLTYLFFELTDSCNLSCKHCGSNCKSANKMFLPYEKIIKVIDRVASKYDAKNIMVCLTGGEPMLHPDFFQIVAYAKAKGFDCGITTNGTLITKENAKRIIDAGIDSVMFSLDGLEENHNWLRNNKNAFSDTVKGIKNLKEISSDSCVIAVTTVVHKKNISELNDIYTFVSELKMDTWRIVNIEPIGRAVDMSDLKLDSEDYRFLFNFIQEKRFSRKCTLDITFGCSHYVTLDYERMVRDTYFMCGSGVYVASVLCNGDIYSCIDIERRPELVQGNIDKDDFVDVWENRFTIFREDRSLKCKDCIKCTDREFCRGDSTHTWNFETNSPRLCLKNFFEERK